MNPFTYARPKSTENAIDALRKSQGRPRILAGGTTLLDLMKLDVERPEHLIDITRIPELASYSVDDRNELVFGALVHMSTVADDPYIKANYPLLSEALWKGASQQIRNMATLGGNLLQRTRCAYFRDVQYPCNKRSPGTGCAALTGINRGHALLGGSDHCIAVYPGDWAAALMAMDAHIDIASPRGTRTFPFSELHVPPGTTPHIETTLGQDELIVRTRIPKSTIGRASAYVKVRDRESYAFALTAAGVAIELDNGKVLQARIALGGVATTPWRAMAAEKSLVGQPLNETTAQMAGRLAFDEAHTRPQNAFRARLGASTVAKALLIAKGRA
jgi:xanthine dehydrogenase YagS FAD-binding subunit